MSLHNVGLIQLAPKGYQCSLLVPNIPSVIDDILLVGKDLIPYCGAGEGLSELLVPEEIFGVKITPACYIHDVMWGEVEKTWENFHFSNSVFLHNMVEIVTSESKGPFMRMIRLHRCVTYYSAVDKFGPKHFFGD